MTPSLEGWPTKAKEAPSPHEVRLALLDTNPIFLMPWGYQMNFFVGAQTCDQFMILSVFGPGPSKNDFQYRALQTLANNVYFNNKLE